MRAMVADQERTERQRGILDRLRAQLAYDPDRDMTVAGLDPPHVRFARWLIARGRIGRGDLGKEDGE